MALYGLKYYKNFRSMQEAGGESFKLEIYQKGYLSATPQEIGAWKGLTLEIDGDDDPVSPIQKTIATFSMVDASDMKDSFFYKFGNWQEFYTPDSTMYKVVISRNGKNFWSGYVTPDNWKESLEYRGEITITARDNIGHLQDFDFDMPASQSGTATLMEIVNAAMAKIDFPMTLDSRLTTMSNSDYKAIVYDEAPLSSFRVNVSAFEGKSWYDALEDILTSLGLCLRFVGDGKFVLTYLRYLPLLDNQGVAALAYQPVKFVGGGTRTLAPAYKKIIDTIKFDYNSEVAFDVTKGLEFDSTIDTYNYTLHSMRWFDNASAGADLLQEKGSMPKYTVVENSGEGWQISSGFHDASEYKIGSDAESILGITNTAFLCANSDTKITQIYKIGIVNIPAGKLTLDICRWALHIIKGTMTIDCRPLPAFLKSIDYALKYQVGSTSYYWDGAKWGSSIAILKYSTLPSGQTIYNSVAVTDSIEVDFSLPDNLSSIPKGGELSLLFDDIVFVKQPEIKYSNYLGVYLGLKGITLEASNPNAKLDSDVVTTINDESYNVTDNIESSVGALSRNVEWHTPQNYSNAIYYENEDRLVVPVGYNMSWDDGSAGEPLPLLRHRQILMYHHLPMQLLEGDCMPEDRKAWDFNRAIIYKGTFFLLQGGVYDFVSGIMTGARLRQYQFYEDLWESQSQEN